MHSFSRLLTGVALAASLSMAGGIPPVGQKAPDFSLTSVSGTTVKLSELNASSPVVLVVLRGFPGYQCPFCQRQVQDFVDKAQQFSDAGFQVVFVYPGPADTAQGKAGEFLQNKSFPPTFHMLVDPGYQFTELYGLRWDAPKETAYPATFLIDRSGVVYFAKVAKMHGGRTSAAEVIELLPKKRPAAK